MADDGDEQNEAVAAATVVRPRLGLNRYNRSITLKQASKSKYARPATLLHVVHVTAHACFMT